MKRSFISRNQSVRIDGVVRAFLEEIDTPKALAVWICYKQDQNALLSLDINPRDYADRDSFHRDYLAVKFLSKYDGLQVSVDPKQVALDSFKKWEQGCRETNRRLIQLTPPGDVNLVIYKAIGKISRLLGDVSSPVLDNILDSARFGPGVTSSCKGRWLSLFDKLGARPDATPRLKDILRRCSASQDFPRFFDINDVNEVAGNVLSTVPKNSKTDRTIAVEPHLNAYFQRGVGIHLRSRLKKWGIDLHSQERNQTLAKLGSIDESLGTLDLSGASDSISTEVVKLLFPSSWVHLFESVRSPCYLDDAGEWQRYHKHSSMGNGYTFELESIVFASIVLASMDVLDISGDWTVYGDDIIAPSAALPLIIESLSYLGFSLNREKSFTEGPFRESCGTDWWDGEQVRPFFYKKKDDQVQLLTFANWLRTEAPSWLNISRTWKLCYQSAAKAFKRRGPLGTPGYVFYVNWWEMDVSAQILYKRPYGPCIGIKVDTLHFVPKKREVEDSPTSLLGALYRSLSRPGFYQAMMDHALSPDAERHSTARQAGKWVQRSVIFDGDWPTVRNV